MLREAKVVPYGTVVDDTLLKDVFFSSEVPSESMAP